MSELVLVDRLLALLGGTAGVVVLCSLWGAYHSWRQTRELEEQVGLLELLVLLHARGVLRESE